MSRTGNMRWLAVFAIGTACLLLATGTAWAQSPFQVNYFSNNVSHQANQDQEVRIINTGTYAPSYPPANLCAMIYVFDSHQEMKACCGCLISTNGLAELSVSQNLTVNPFNGVVPNDGDIKIVSALENDYVSVEPPSGPPEVSNVDCDPSGGGFNPEGGYNLNLVPVSGLVAWSTHLPGYKTADGRTTEDEFQNGNLRPGELDSLQEECAGVIADGSGSGICTGPAPNSSTVCDFTSVP